MRRLCRSVRLVAGVLLMLAGCGNDPQRADLPAQLRQILGRIGQPQPAPTAADIRARLTPAVRAQLGNAPLMIATLADPDRSALLIGVGQNGPVATFSTPDGITFQLRDGVLVGTRGLGHDLMSADMADTLAAIQAGGARDLVRIHRYLGGENRIVIHSYICDLIPAADGALREDCQGPRGAFTNRYRLDRAGRVVMSRQWIGPAHGHVLLQDATGGSG